MSLSSFKQKGKKAAASGELHLPQLSEQDFRKLKDLIEAACGIRMPPSKRTMLAARLRKRLMRLGISSYGEYYAYLLSREGKEREFAAMIDAVTTNKTDFFREPQHFELLSRRILPELRAKLSRRVEVWSAGCASGQEPYTLAMVLEEFRREHPGFDYALLGTDICTAALSAAMQGVYPDEYLEPVPAHLKRRYLMRGKGRYQGFHRVVPELRAKVTFRRLNFMDRDYGIDRKMDIIFCRNVIIYFDRATQKRLFDKFRRQFAPGGYLFTGHSESIEGVAPGLERIATAVYRCPISTP